MVLLSEFVSLHITAHFSFAAGLACSYIVLHAGTFLVYLSLCLEFENVSRVDIIHPASYNSYARVRSRFMIPELSQSTKYTSWSNLPLSLCVCLLYVAAMRAGKQCVHELYFITAAV